MELTREVLSGLPFYRRIEIEANIQRKGFTQSELASIQEEIRSCLESRFPRGRKAEPEKCQDLVTLGANRVDEVIGQIFGESRENVRKRREVVKAANEDPNGFGDLAEEMDHSGSINRAYRILVERQNQGKVKSVPLPEGVFDVIYADPPWRYESPFDATRSIEVHYSTMELEQIKALPVPSTDNAVLFLWATSPKVKEAMEVMESWGFLYRTQAIWDKESIGLGHWWRNQHENLFLGVKGSFPVPVRSDRVSSVYREKRREHSRKPDHYYELIEKMCPGRNYLELFSRSKPRPGWTMWGWEAEPQMAGAGTTSKIQWAFAERTGRTPQGNAKGSPRT